MDILINELSLDGQYTNENDFLNSLKKILPIIKIINNLNFSLQKNYTFYSSKVTTSKTFSDIIKLNNVAMEKDKKTQLKSYLLKLSNTPPYWNDTQIHNCSDKYFYNDNDVCDTSLAETYERDKIVLSFDHINFLAEWLSVQKNGLNSDIYNISDKNNFLEHLQSIKQIDMLNFCKEKFKNSNLNFDFLDNNYGFDILNTLQQREFLDTFNIFIQLDWHTILSHSKLNYKQYKGTEINYQNKTIDKFRVTGTSNTNRCFGYRENNTFYILRFEVDHSLSDNG